MIWSPWGFYLSDLSALQQFVNYHSGSPTMELLSSEASAPLSFLCLHPSFSSTGGTVVCSATSFHLQTKWVVGFSACSVSYLFLGWSGDLWTFYMLGQKPEVFLIAFCSSFTPLLPSVVFECLVVSFWFFSHFFLCIFWRYFLSGCHRCYVIINILNLEKSYFSS